MYARQPPNQPRGRPVKGPGQNRALARNEPRMYQSSPSAGRSNRRQWLALAPWPPQPWPPRPWPQCPALTETRDRGRRATRHIPTGDGAGMRQGTARLGLGCHWPPRLRHRHHHHLLSGREQGSGSGTRLSKGAGGRWEGVRQCQLFHSHASMATTGPLHRRNERRRRWSRRWSAARRWRHRK